MEKYYRMIIDLYKEALANHQVNSDRFLEVKKEIACAITEARISNQDTRYLLELEKDVRELETISQ